MSSTRCAAGVAARSGAAMRKLIDEHL